jgi:hypothetical protein
VEGEIGAGDRITVVEQSGELSVKRRQLRDLERKFAETQKLLTANSDFRNDLIWMSQDINKLKSEIGRLEKLAGKK